MCECLKSQAGVVHLRLGVSAHRGARVGWSTVGGRPTVDKNQRGYGLWGDGSCVNTIRSGGKLVAASCVEAGDPRRLKAVGNSRVGTDVSWFNSGVNIFSLREHKCWAVSELPNVTPSFGGKFCRQFEMLVWEVEGIRLGPSCYQVRNLSSVFRLSPAEPESN